LDYSASEAITWQISLRYESVTYSNTTSNTGGSSQATSANRDNPYAKQAEAQIKLNQAMQEKIDKTTALSDTFANQARDQIKLNELMQKRVDQAAANAAAAIEQEAAVNQAISVQVPGGSMTFANQASLEAWESGRGNQLVQTQLPGGAVFTLPGGNP
jgi:hypothetical protein